MTVCQALKPTASAPRRSTGSGGRGLRARIARSRLWTTFTWNAPKTKTTKNKETNIVAIVSGVEDGQLATPASKASK